MLEIEIGYIFQLILYHLLVGFFSDQAKGKEMTMDVSDHCLHLSVSQWCFVNLTEVRWGIRHNVSDNVATVNHVLQQLENSFSTIIDIFFET